MSAHRYLVVLAKLLCAAIAAGSPAIGHAASTDFIQTYLEANVVCGGGGSLAFVLAGSGRQAPFGKPAALWTDKDLDALNNSLSTCINSVARSGNPYALTEVSGEAKRILTEVPQIVSSARAQKTAYDRQIAARKRMAEARIQSAAKAAETGETSQQEVARLEREATKAELEASIARQQRDFEKQKERLRVARERAETERQQQAAALHQSEKVAALEADRQRRAFLASHNLVEASVLDLQSNGKAFENKAVAVVGYIRVFNEDNVSIYSGPNEMTGIPLDLSTASSDARRKIFADCSNIYRDCRMEIAGVVGFADHVFIWVQ